MVCCGKLCDNSYVILLDYPCKKCVRSINLWLERLDNCNSRIISFSFPDTNSQEDEMGNIKRYKYYRGFLKK